MHVYVDVYAKFLSVKMMCCCDMWNKEIRHNDCWDDEIMEIIFFSYFLIELTFINLVYAFCLRTSKDSSVGEFDESIS